MSISMNIFGRLTRDPEVKQARNGNNFVIISVAVNHGKNEHGEDETTFVELTAFGKTSEHIAQYGRKGARISVAASNVKLDKWVSQNGAQGSTLRGTIQQVDIVDWPDNTQQPTQAAPQPQYGQELPPQGHPQGYGTNMQPAQCGQPPAVPVPSAYQQQAGAFNAVPAQYGQPPVQQQASQGYPRQQPLVPASGQPW